MLLAIFAPLLAFTQERCWTIVRAVGIKFWNPIHLENTDDPYALERLSQVGAMFSPRRIKYSHPSRVITIPEIFRIAAIINLLAFIAIGILTTVFLTGQFSTSIVQSKDTDTCIGYEDRFENKQYTAQLADNYFKQCLYSRLNNSFCSQESGILGSTPTLHIKRDDHCPFSGNICQENIKPLRLEYLRLSPRDFGVNLAGAATVDHRVVCAPLKAEVFLVPTTNYGPETKSLIWFGPHFHDPAFNLTPGSPLYGTFLGTLNGPNRFSSEYSGHFLANLSRPEPAYDLTVYPFGNYITPSIANENIHPDLRRDDGSVFITMLRAGRSIYQERILDPFYAAHKTALSPTTYFPDYEATALGCVEQFRLCQSTEDLFCTNWASSLDSIGQLVAAYQNISSIGPLLPDLLFIYPLFTSLGSLQRYFQIRTGSQTLLASVFRQGDIVPFVNREEQWIQEVQAWFTTAFLNTRYSLLHYLRYRVHLSTVAAHLSSLFPGSYMRKRTTFLVAYQFSTYIVQSRKQRGYTLIRNACK